MQQLIRPVHQKQSNDPAVSAASPQTMTAKKGNREIYPAGTFAAKSQNLSTNDTPQGNNADSAGVTGNQLVENRVAGLLNPESQLMRKAQASGMQFAASRGLQSSTLASEAVTSAMLDKALTIAQQDATTYKEHGLQGKQFAHTSSENTKKYAHESSIADKQIAANSALEAQRGKNALAQIDRQAYASRELEKLRNQNQIGQLDIQGQQRLAELEAQAESNADLENLRNQNQLGQLDAQGQQRMAELEAQAAITTQRDITLNGFEDARIKAQLEAQMAQLDKKIQIDLQMQANTMTHDQRMNYASNMNTVLNNSMQQIAAIYQNPEMSASQQANAIRQIEAARTSYMAKVGLIYGLADEGGQGQGTNSPSGSIFDINTDADTTVRSDAADEEKLVHTRKWGDGGLEP